MTYNEFALKLRLSALDNQSWLVLLNAACLAEKKEMPIL